MMFQCCNNSFYKNNYCSMSVNYIIYSKQFIEFHYSFLRTTAFGIMFLHDTINKTKKEICEVNAKIK